MFFKRIGGILMLPLFPLALTVGGIDNITFTKNVSLTWSAWKEAFWLKGE